MMYTLVGVQRIKPTHTNIRSNAKAKTLKYQTNCPGALSTLQSCKQLVYLDPVVHNPALFKSVVNAETRRSFQTRREAQIPVAYARQLYTVV